MSYTLSVVQICPDAYRAAADAIAEAAGYGPGNLSVPLLDGEGAIWWGCHAWWTAAALEASSAPPVDPETGEEVPGAAEVLAQVITSVRQPVIPSSEEALLHWNDTLAEHGLLRAEYEAE